MDFFVTVTGELPAVPVFNIRDLGDDTHYDVAVSTDTGSGTLRLNVHQDSDVEDLMGNLLIVVALYLWRDIRDPHRRNLPAGHYPLKAESRMGSRPIMPTKSQAAPLASSRSWITTSGGTVTVLELNKGSDLPVVAK